MFVQFAQQFSQTFMFVILS